jgi:integrase
MAGNNHINFTKKTIEELPAPNRNTRLYFHDTKQPGLSIYVTKSGARTFFVRNKANGADDRIVLGRYPDLSIENARKMASKVRGDIANGKDPQEHKRIIRNEMTFGELFETYMERYSKRHKRSWKYDEREVNKFLSHWFRRKLTRISQDDVYKEFHRIADNHGIYQANRMLERIRAMFNKGIEWGWEGRNPALGIKKFREKSRDRFLLPEEVSRFFDALAQEENVTARDFILMALLTGARKGNVLAMQWKDISLQNEIWRIPDTKNGEPHNVPLSPQAMEILHKRKQIQELSDLKTPYVFPGEGKEGHFADPKKPWQRLREKSELHDLRLHDLRRTLGSWQALQGTSTAIIGKSLGHKSMQSTAVYERLTLEPVRQSVQNATEALFAAAKQNEDAFMLEQDY